MKEDRERSGAQADEIAFESIDACIFNIPDDKTRLNTLQNYFFPRLKRLLELQCDAVREVYELEPYEGMTLTYRPAHRKDAKAVRDLGEVYVGLTPAKAAAPIAVARSDGSKYLYHPSSLLIVAHPEGALSLSFRPYMYLVDNPFKKKLHGATTQAWEQVGPILEMAGIRPYCEEPWTLLRDSLLTSCSWGSPLVHFPVAESSWLHLLELPFLALYPMLDTSARLARGQKPRLDALCERFQTFVDTLDDEAEAESEAASDRSDDRSPADSASAALDSYRVVRPGIWFQVLSRDNFTCCGCNRSSKGHGVVLHVDHIVPRSRGGTDDQSNLQTLCMKCNLGKSNRDQTRLTKT